MKLDLDPAKRLDMLEKAVHLDLSLNDLRIIVGCMRAVAYQMDVDDEPYLDSDALALKEKLELQYRSMLETSADTRSTH
jgi:hypothetical protein